jgi:hypothetical protein
MAAMCFSATGSFTVAGLLVGIGAASVSSNASVPHRMYAAVPLIFAAQQAAEGVVWLTIDQLAYARLLGLAVTAFLAVAFVLWPVWLPLSLLRIERSAPRRRGLAVLLVIGAAVAVASTVLLLRWQPVAQIAGHSIRYAYPGEPFGWPAGVGLAIYAVPTVLPFFLSSASLTRSTGILLLVSLIVAALVQRDTLTSVWCFFAAVLSTLVLATVLMEQRQPVVAAASGRGTP